MRLWILLAVVAGVLVVTASPAGAKYVSEGITIEGPGMDVPGLIRSRRSIDQVYSATLLGTQRARTARPAKPGPAFLLEFEFGVADENGARTETVKQILYPFAPGGAVVLTPRGQGFAMSYGPVRFRPGWFAVPPRVLRILEDGGLPGAPARLEPSGNAPRHADPPVSWLPGAGIAAVATATLALLVGRRRGRFARSRS